MGSIIFLSILFLVIILFIAAAIVIIRPYEIGLVERLGKFYRTLTPGINFVIPIIDRVIKVDMREHVIDVPPQEVICKDNVVVVVDAVVYYRIIDAPKAIYNVGNYLQAIIKLAQTNLRSIIGEMELDETLSGREIINAKLREELDKATDQWGVKVTRVEIQKIDPPASIQEAMAKQMKAEREKRAMILEAEGMKQSAILKAEGQKEAQIRKAEGDKIAAILRAEGQAEAIRKIVDALSTADEKYLTIQYLEKLPEMAKPGNMLIPYDAQSLASLLKTISFVYKEGGDR